MAAGLAVVGVVELPVVGPVRVVLGVERSRLALPDGAQVVLVVQRPALLQVGQPQEHRQPVPQPKPVQRVHVLYVMHAANKKMPMRDLARSINKLQDPVEIMN